jgi:hypothetical protein
LSFWSKVKGVAKVIPVVGPAVSALDDTVPDTKSADDAAKRAADVADKAAGNLDAAQKRVSNPGTVVATTADPTNVGPNPINSTSVTVDKTGPTSAPSEVKVDPITGGIVYAPSDLGTLGSRVAGSTGATTVTAPGLDVDHQGAGYQNEAALALQRIATGQGETPGEMAVRAAEARANAEQLSQAAGARGQGVASARRNAANNTSLQAVEFGGQAAQARAQDIANATQQLAQVGGQIQGQTLAEAGKRADLTSTADLANQKALNDATQASQERFARGEITKEQMQSDIAKANAEFSQRTQEKNQEVSAQTKLDHAHQQLQADLASDDRLQKSFDLEAQLEAEAAKGNQDSAVKLQALQAQIDTQIKQFNANQIQTASSQNIANRLTAMHLDDSYVESMSQQWLQAEQSGNTAALDALKIKIGAVMDQAQQDKQWHDAFKEDAKDAFKAAASKFAPTGSDVRIKEDIAPIHGPDVDGFMKAVSKTANWKYKPGMGPPGPQIGPMANDVATSPLGMLAVGVRPDDGAMTLDYQKLAAMALMSAGRLNDRVEKLEGKKGKPAPDVVGFLKAKGKLK